MVTVYINIKKILIYILYFLTKYSKNSLFKKKVKKHYQFFKFKKENSKIFLTSKLKKSNKYSYYYLDPMPSYDSINNYY